MERLQELFDLVDQYYHRYMQDEAEEVGICIDDEQHILAVAIRDVLTEIRSSR